ncbi:MAG: regulatory protein RecX [Acidobacteriales bacterium]|nr:regulatory protein RecX [Terriglobales bacterium]
MAFPRSKKTYDPESLYEYAVEALGRRMRSVAEMKRLLRQKNVAGDRDAAIESVVQRLKDHKYLNDSRFAEMYATFRKEGQKLGRQRVVTDLKVKGVHGDVIEKSVGAAYADTDEEKLAREYLKRKRVKPPAKARRDDAAGRKQSQKDTARIFRMLARAGFRTGTIFNILKKWDVEEEVLSVLEEEAIEPAKREDAD